MVAAHILVGLIHPDMAELIYKCPLEYLQV